MREDILWGDYQRFVAYVYEYLKGKKEKNCGFVKAEAREGVFSMELEASVSRTCAGYRMPCIRFF